MRRLGAGSQIAVHFVRIPRKSGIPEPSQCHLLRLRSAVAIREARCNVGDCVMEVVDIIAGRVPGDRVSRAYDFWVDRVRLHAPAKGLIGIPYRALLPKGLEGLLAAGRRISATHDSLGGFQGLCPAMNIGQAPGIAAALSAKRGVTPRQVRAQEIQNASAALGVAFWREETGA